MIGQVVAGRYRVDSQIGIGGMGIVYRAHDTKLRRDVALKVIAPHLVEDEDARARFLREAQALAGLSHPNIVTVYDLAEDPETGNVFIVMELLNGSPLRQRITDPQRPAFTEMAIQVCRALECAHAHGILHRDIKPENIFVCSDGTIKLMDFGLARLADAANVSQSGMVTGTVAYMAPEQLRGKPLDPRTDLYSLGVLLYEYLTGFTPFVADNAGATLLKHLTEPPPSLRARVAGVSLEMEALIMRLLEKEPEARYPSALILRDALERMRAGISAVAPPLTLVAGNSAEIPLTVPRPKTVRRGTTYQPMQRSSRYLWRLVALVSTLLVVAFVAFAFGETLLHTWIKLPGSDEKKAASIKKPERTAKPAGARKRTRRKSRRIENASGPTTAPGPTETPKTPNETAESQNTGENTSDTVEEAPPEPDAENPDSSNADTDHKDPPPNG